jgi:hypothetical protein
MTSTLKPTARLPIVTKEYATPLDHGLRIAVGCSRRLRCVDGGSPSRPVSDEPAFREHVFNEPACDEPASNGPGSSELWRRVVAA